LNIGLDSLGWNISYNVSWKQPKLILEFFPLYKCKCSFTQGRDFFGGEFSPFGKKYYGERKKNVKNFPF
jgi:hypothetical protein